ncbi:uncharacterized protein [Rutidosis leptorrhynchoides]|uniref:uncharacterized protein n=1 Tax=Rutidosis leptorrhynchoides TaxID=125765 RepID=UPI003A9A30D0
MTSDCLKLNDWDGPCLNSHMVEKLEARFCETEILQTIKSCDKHKVLGLDGFNTLFYTKYWDIIKEDLVNALNWFWENETISNGCNASFITLIPKVEQSAFISDRYTLYGILIALEPVEELKAKKQKSFIFKVDFEKAFDCLDCDFLSILMDFMGFGLNGPIRFELV